MRGRANKWEIAQSEGKSTWDGTLKARSQVQKQEDNNLSQLMVIRPRSHKKCHNEKEVVQKKLVPSERVPWFFFQFIAQPLHSL